MGVSELRPATLPTLLTEACEQLEIAHPTGVMVDAVPAADGGQYEVTIRPTTVGDLTPQSRRAIGAWGLALYRFDQRDQCSRVVFPNPTKLAPNMLQVKVNLPAYLQIMRAA